MKQGHVDLQLEESCGLRVCSSKKGAKMLNVMVIEYNRKKVDPGQMQGLRCESEKSVEFLVLPRAYWDSLMEECEVLIEVSHLIGQDVRGHRHS